MRVLELSGFEGVTGDRAPVWTPDARALVYVVSDLNSPDLAMLWLDGSGRERFVIRFGADAEPSVGPRAR
ncbi:MAG: hypothetical protein FJ029_15480 [Actinobacteria bacterium]|nr:hypothetical protein [Actinomycetota bacterium]